MTDLPPPPPPAPDDYPPRHLVIDVAPRSIVFVLTVVVAIVLTYQMLTGIPAVLIRTALGLLLGLALDPVVGAAMRRLNVGRAAPSRWWSAGSWPPPGPSGSWPCPGR